MINIVDVFGTPLNLGDTVYLIRDKYLDKRIVKRFRIGKSYRGDQVGVGESMDGYTAYTYGSRVISCRSLADKIDK